jgi:hexosaminidase
VNATNDWPATLPSLREWIAGPGRLVLSSPLAIGCAGPDAQEVAELLAGDLERLYGYRPQLGTGDGAIRLVLDPERDDIPDEGYTLDIDDNVLIVASTRSGLLYACQSLLQLLKQGPELPRGKAFDHPRCAVRGQMIDVGRKFLPMEYLRSEVRRMAWMKLNSLHLHLTEWNGFRFESLEFPGLASADHYTQQELRELDAYAAQWGVRIVPEIDVPGHAVWLTRYEPRLRTRSPVLDYAGWPGGRGGGWTLDLTSDFARDLVRRLVLEVADVFSGEFVHIGSDEVPLQTRENQDPELLAYAHSKGLRYAGDVLVDFIDELAAALRERGKRAEIWEWWCYGDQPVSIAPSKDVRIDKWLDGDPAELSREGYQTVGVNWGGNYVTPGYSTTPGGSSPQGFEGYMPAERIYERDDYPTNDLLLGYRLGRWMDKAEARTTAWVHFFSHRPLQVLADRTWGGPPATSAAAFYERADLIGAADDTLTGVPAGSCRVVEVSSEETKAEDGSVHHVLSPDPQTQWVTRYRNDLEITPHHVVIDVGVQRLLAGLEIWPRQDGRVVDDLHHSRARAERVRILLGDDRRDWREVWSGILPNEQPAHTVRFPATLARYLKVIVDSDWDNLFVTSIAYLSVLEARIAVRIVEEAPKRAP